jgi:circadian clock protein KaiB
VSDNKYFSSPPPLFKGIVLFTPGGDLVYCIDPYKQNRWHLQLCAVLQDLVGLPEPPHFLVPFYSATIDRWLDPQTRQIRTFAEACPAVLRYQSLLNALFGIDRLAWEIAPRAEGIDDSALLTIYRGQVPQLWEHHDLVVRLDARDLSGSSNTHSTVSWSPSSVPDTTQGYVLRLFISGHSAATERILQNLHQLLETSLQQPYTLKVVDIHKHPEQAEVNQIAATPTLMKVWPRPVRRIVGELDNASKLLQVLTSDNEHGNNPIV